MHEMQGHGQRIRKYHRFFGLCMYSRTRNPRDQVKVCLRPGPREFPEFSDDPVGISIADEIAFPDEPVMHHLEILHRYLESVQASRDLSRNFFTVGGSPFAHKLHQGVYLLGYGRILFDFPVCCDIYPGQYGHPLSHQPSECCQGYQIPRQQLQSGVPCH